MPLPEIPNVFRVAFNWENSASGGTAENVMHFLSETGDSEAVAAAINSHYSALMLSFTVPTTKCPSVSITPLDGTTATSTWSLAGVEGSLSAGEALPAVAVVATLYTALRGRSYRGRIYLPYVGESVAESGKVKPDYLADLQGGWGDFQADLEGNTPPVTLVVASYKEEVANAVTSILVQPVLATQRRRQSQLR